MWVAPVEAAQPMVETLMMSSPTRRRSTTPRIRTSPTGPEAQVQRICPIAMQGRQQSPNQTRTRTEPKLPKNKKWIAQLCPRSICASPRRPKTTQPRLLPQWVLAAHHPLLPLLCFHLLVHHLCVGAKARRLIVMENQIRIARGLSQEG